MNAPPRSLWLPRARLPVRAGVRVAVWACSGLAFALLLLLAAGPRLLGYRVATVFGDSMAPTFHRGDLIVTVPLGPEQVRVGDILTFASPAEPDALVTHRVIEVVHAGAAPVVRTRGDANPIPDPWEAQLHGTLWKVRSHVPKLGGLLAWLRSPVAVLLGRYGALLAFTVLSLWYLWAPRPRLRGSQAVRPTDGDAFRVPAGATPSSTR